MKDSLLNGFPDIEKKIEAGNRKNKTQSGLIYWKDEQRAIPNDIGRSALFADRRKGERPFLDDELIWSRKEIQMTFCGHGLDQSDASLFLELLHLQRNKTFGEKVFVKKSELLKSLKLNKGGRQYELLENSLERLRGDLKITKSLKNGTTKTLLSGSLLSIYGIDEDTNRFYFKIDNEVLNLFTNKNYALLINESRIKLNGLAKSLQMHIATSSATKQSFSYEMLKERLCRNSEIRYLKRDLRIACEQLKKNKVINSFDLKKDKLHIIRRKITE